MVCNDNECLHCGRRIGFRDVVAHLFRPEQAAGGAAVTEFSCPACGNVFVRSVRNPWVLIAKIDFVVLSVVIAVGFVVLYDSMSVVMLLLMMAIANVAVFFVSIYIYYCKYIIASPPNG